MIAIIIGIIITIILTIIFKKEAKEYEVKFDGGHVLLAAAFGLLLAFLTDLLAWGIYANVAIETAKTSEIVATANLATLQDNASMSGSFFLGSGSVSNKNYYAFYYETDHGYKYETLDAESASRPVYIKYIPAGEIPHIDQYAVVERKNMAADGRQSWLFSIIAWLKYNKYGAGEIISAEVTSPALLSNSGAAYYDQWRYEIHIPEGSIKQDYTIDLE